MITEDHYTFFLLKPSTLRRRAGFLWNHTVAEEIVDFLRYNGFEVVKAFVSLSSKDAEFPNGNDNSSLVDEHFCQETPDAKNAHEVSALTWFFLSTPCLC
ncbi:MAG: hypothetical protein V1837_05545 [Candidatus Woesearchaeota archaeon]